MKVTQVSLGPTQASLEAGRPVLTPELLAATGARYSRNNEGLDSIVAKIDFDNTDKSVDSIFRMLDYGHQSIADMTPVAMFLDGISMFAAYYIFSEAPLQGGQESSTRYLKIDESLLLDPVDDLGLDQDMASHWNHTSREMLHLYEKSLEMWAQHAVHRPHVTRIPTSLLEDKSDKAQKQVARMMRNYAFDRARYFIPVGCATNAMMVMSAREWVRVINLLLSSSLLEFNRIGEAIKAELALVAPRLIKHAIATESTRECLAYDLKDMLWFKHLSYPQLEDGALHSIYPEPILRTGEGTHKKYISPEAMQFRTNRYGRFGVDIRNLQVQYGWSAVAFAEIRDLNRHRTGSKYCPLKPLGFYCALDEVADNVNLREFLSRAEEQVNNQVVESVTNHMLYRMDSHTRSLNVDARYIYTTLLGTQYAFLHSTTADKFLYTAELRTGVGAHYRYAKHFHDVLELWYREFPHTKEYVLEGSAEPE
jgi:thymidylate synthase ThyX